MGLSPFEFEPSFAFSHLCVFRVQIKRFLFLFHHLFLAPIAGSVIALHLEEGDKWPCYTYCMFYDTLIPERSAV